MYSKAFWTGLQPDPDISVWEWADKNRVLTSVASREAGQYRTSRTPYMREIMECLSVRSPVTEIVIMKGTQIGGSEAANNFLGYVIDCAPGPILYMLPTVELAEDHSKNRIAPMIEKTPSLMAKVSPQKSRDGGNTVLSKKFLGGALYMAGSNSGASYRNKSIRYLILDDIDGFLPDVDGEGNPIHLAERRTDTYGSRKKILKVSTPTLKGASMIEAEFLTSDQRYYHVPCPFCGGKQVLEWGGKDKDFGIKFIRGEDESIDVWYECKFCHNRIDEHHKGRMLEAGEWIPKYPNRLKRGYHINGFMSPPGFVSWEQIVKEFLQSKKDRLSLKVWVNTRKGETWEEIGTQPEWALLAARCEPYQPFVVPSGAAFITGGVDVQEDRIAVVLRAWGPGEESWLIWHGEIFEDQWGQLDRLLAMKFVNTGGQVIPIAGVGVDAGFRTQEVYQYCRTRGPVVFAVKGERTKGRPVIGRPTLQDVSFKGALIKQGVQLWPIGTDTAKATIYGRFREKTEPGPGCYHWYIGTSEEYFQQVTAEKIETRVKDGFPVMEWVKTRERNEALDCEVYAYAAAIRAGISWVQNGGDAVGPRGGTRGAPVIKNRYQL
ncbi:MAG: phage terminase large subunit family protein [Chloroflexota bacterium]